MCPEGKFYIKNDEKKIGFSHERSKIITIKVSFREKINIRIYIQSKKKKKQS
jgi:hypothetical protein